MNALVIEREGLSAKLLTQVLERLGFAHIVVEWPYRGVDFLRSQRFDLCVVNVDRRLDLRRFLRILREQDPDTHVLFLSEKRSRDHYNEVLVDLKGRHLVSKASYEDGEWVVSPEHLSHAVRRLWFPRKDMGLESLLPDAKMQRQDITGTPEKGRLFLEVETFAEGFGLRSRMVQNIVHLCDELVMNVIFNAPHDAAGKYRYRGMPRDAKVVLTTEERGALQYGFDGRVFGLSAVDPFGALTIDTVSNYLTRSYREYVIGKGQEGGGMGLLNLFAFASFFEVYVMRGKLTRVTVLLNVREGLRKARTSPRSLSLLEVG